MSEEQVTWKDCLIAQDELIELIRGKMLEEPEHGLFWNQSLAFALCQRQEILIKVEQEKNL